MAVKLKFNYDLTEPCTITSLHVPMFEGDRNVHKVVVVVTENKIGADLRHKTAVFRIVQGDQMNEQPCEITNNMVSVLMPECGYIPGRVSMFIRLMDEREGSTTTIWAANGIVERTN